MNIIPVLNLKPTSNNVFIQGLVLTLSNPITIVFWGSILTTRIIEDNLNKKELIAFSIGLVSSTIIFLTFIAISGTILSNFIPEKISNILNILVGILIVFFGIKMIVKKEKWKNGRKNVNWNCKCNYEKVIARVRLNASFSQNFDVKYWIYQDFGVKLKYIPIKICMINKQNRILKNLWKSKCNFAISYILS